MEDQGFESALFLNLFHARLSMREDRDSCLEPKILGANSQPQGAGLHVQVGDWHLDNGRFGPVGVARRPTRPYAEFHVHKHSKNPKKHTRHLSGVSIS